MDALPDVAMWFNSIDPILFSARARELCRVICIADTPTELFARSRLPPESLITVHSAEPLACPTFSDLLHKTDLAQVLHQEAVHHLVIPDSRTASLEAWADANHVSLVASPRTLQELLEHKVHFDALMRQYDVPAPRTMAPDEALVRGCTYVVQRHDGAGGIGTFFHRAGEEPFPVPDRQTVLVREYLPGIPVGISIMRTSGDLYVVSKLRRQCFEYDHDLPRAFLGIQWLPDTYLSSKARESMVRAVASLCTLFRGVGFTGIANVDLVVHDDVAYVIECNPRLSAATPQLFGIPGLSDSPDPFGMFLAACGVPVTPTDARDAVDEHVGAYSGAILQVDAPAHTTFEPYIALGTYAVVDGALVARNGEEHGAVDSDILLYHDVLDGAADMPEPYTALTALSDTPLYDSDSGQSNERGAALLDLVASRSKRITT